MLKRTFAVTAVLLLNACSGHYVVGAQDEDGGDGGMTSTPTAGNTDPGMGTGGVAPSFGGHTGMNPPVLGGSSSMNPPDMQAGTMGMGASGGEGMTAPNPTLACDDPGMLPRPMGLIVSPEEAWKRLTRFIVGEELEPEALPSRVTREWLESTAEWLYLAYPDGPMFELMLREAGVDEDAAATYGALLHEPMRTPSALFASNPSSSDELYVDAGLLTDPRVLTQYPTISQRGGFILKAFLCTEAPPEPPNLERIPFVVRPGQTRREALEEAVDQVVCKGCHSLIDPLGYSLENFDEQGEYRTEDNGKPIDASGSFPGFGRTAFEFTDYLDFRQKLASSCDFTRCFSQRLLLQAIAMSRDTTPDPLPPSLEYDIRRLSSTLFSQQGTVLDLVRLIASSPSFIE